MIVHWMRVGFVHGVMNTDNMSILGLTIDYGPYGWLENYDPDWTPNTTDAAGRRYRFGNQPGIAQWNLVQLANALYPLIEAVEPLQEALEEYGRSYREGRQEMMAAKLGLERFTPGPDDELVADLLSLLPRAETDMTIFFRRLARFDPGTHPPGETRDETLLSPLLEAYYRPEQLTPSLRMLTAAWLRRYLKRLEEEKVPREGGWPA